MNFTVCLCCGEMPVLNEYIGAFKSYTESLKLHNSYFVGSTCVGILFSEDWKHCTKVTELVIFHSSMHAYSAYMLYTLLLKKKK